MSPFLEGEPTPSEGEEVDEGRRRLEFMKSHTKIIAARLLQYLNENPDVDVDVDDIPAEVWDRVVEECFLENQIAEKKAKIEAEIAQLSGDEDERPLGNLTYDEASYYFTRYCELMQEKVGFYEKEARLPTSLERMKEALKVECLNWCNHGKDFDESCEFIATGYMMLAQVLPDELAEKASPERRPDGAESEDMEALRVWCAAAKAAGELCERRANELNAEWNEFQEEYRDKY